MTRWLVICLTTLTATTAANAAPRLSKKRLEAHVRHLASRELEGRGVDKPGGLKARQYIIDQFREFGLKPGAKKGWLQPLTLVGQGANVLGLLRGSDPKLNKEVVIVGAHYDHLGIRGGKMYRGANDNAAGVAVILELARVLSGRKNRPARSVLFACWDFEEGGLHGSREYVTYPTIPLRNVTAYLDMDLIGRDFLDVLPRKVFVIGSESAKGLEAIVDRAAKGRKLDVLRLGADLVGPRCDFWNFRNKKVPHLFFSCAEHHDYHQTTDLPDRIRYDKLHQIGTMIHHTLSQLAGPSPRPTYNERLRYSTQEAGRVARLIDEMTAVTRMGRVEKLLWSLASRRLTRIARKKRFSSADRNALRLVVIATLVRRRIKPFQRIDQPPKKAR